MEMEEHAAPVDERFGSTCVRCGRRAGMPGLDLCTPCAVSVRVELSGGIVRLEGYLARWAAFDAWLNEHGLGGAVA